MRWLATLALLAASPAAAEMDHAMMKSPADLAEARAQLVQEHGAMTFSQVMIRLAEIRPGGQGTGYAWNAEAWTGGDIDRLALKSEGDGESGGQDVHGHTSGNDCHPLENCFRHVRPRILGDFFIR